MMVFYSCNLKFFEQYCSSTILLDHKSITFLASCFSFSYLSNAFMNNICCRVVDYLKVELDEILKKMI